MGGDLGLYVISDCREALTGLALGGIPGQLAATPEELHRALESIPPHVGIVIITSSLAAKSADIIENYRGKNRMPLITVVPDRLSR